MSKIVNYFIAKQGDSIDEKLVQVFVQTIPILCVIVSIITYFVELEPANLSPTLLGFGLFVYLLGRIRKRFPLWVQRLTFTLILYAFMLYIWAFSPKNHNDLFLFLVNLISTLIIYRKHYISIVISNLLLVFGLAYYQYSRGYFMSEDVDYVYRSLQVNYFVLVTVAVLVIYTLVENIRSEQQNQLDSKREIEEKNALMEVRNEELKRLNGTQRRMLAIISHDVKNPIDSLTGMVALLKKGMLSQSELDKITEQLHRQLSNTSLNLSNLLSWARKQSEQIILRKERFSIESAIKEVASFVQEFAKTKNIQLNINHNTNNFAYGDVYILHIVLRNLLSNAIKFTPVKGTIEINVQSDDELISVEIKDSGIGMNKETVQKLFVEGQTTLGTEGEKGNGFGLFLAKEYAVANGGNIWAESTEGKGSSFIFTIPVYQNEKVNSPLVETI